jgi:pimeloyl-ACP methyl ester carboxylesterase
MSTLVFNLMKVLLILLLAIGCTSLLPPTFTPAVPTATTSAPFTPSVTPINNVLTQTLTMGEYQYTMECSREGSPVVLLLGGRAAAWKPIQAEINRITRTCIFDHTGSRSTSLTAKEIVENVHLLLKDAELTAPYVLVGFSVGGYITRLFADLYPDEVGGMVLLDSSHEEQNARFLAALPSETSNECQELKDYRAELQGPHVIPVAPQISLDFDTSADEVRAVDENLRNLPLIVLTAGRSEWPDCFPPEVAQQLDQAWLNMQDELASLSSNSAHIVAKESGHAFDDPVGMQAVIEAIQRVIDAVRNGVGVSIP